MIEMRWVVFRDGRQLEFRQTLNAPSGMYWTEWEKVPEVDGTHPAIKPARE